VSDRGKRSATTRVGDDDGVRIVGRDARGRRAVLWYLLLFVLACSAGIAVTRRQVASLPVLATKASAPPAIDGSRGPAHLPESEHHAASSTRVSGATEPVGVGYVATRPPAPPRAAEADEPGDTTLDLSDFIPPGEQPTMGEVIEELHARGIYEGLGAFPPPGTSPPLVGLAVPDDFELPPGYVRHHQTTDDGQDIEPILMFSPDYDFVDENGNPIPIPGDRVVPPDMAPPGLPIREVDIPPDREPGRPAH